MISSDRKFYKTDIANTKNIFWFIRSILNPKAEQIKMWLTKVGNARIDELVDQKKAIKSLAMPSLLWSKKLAKKFLMEVIFISKKN